MKIYPSEQVICVDVDDTLVVWGTVDGQPSTLISCPHTEEVHEVTIHIPHLKIVKTRLSRGATVIVWSAGGYEWAAAVVKHLGLSHPNLHVFSKPIAYIDDKKAEIWMGEHIYLHPSSKYGKIK